MAELYHKLSRCRLGLGVCVLLLLGLGWIGFLRQPLSGDVAALLPDHDLVARADFQALARAPLARRIVLRLRATDGQLSPERLFALAAALKAKLTPPLFAAVSNGPGVVDTELLQDFALEHWANLFTAADLAGIVPRLEPAALDQALMLVRQELLSPAAFLQKQALLADPSTFAP
ncbi:MAG: hypothetical protein JXR89_03905 [Deltaproteobacteria bacterium]|nr:hypothetical protein [Deltaproteobacteria bacterium]